MDKSERVLHSQYGTISLTPTCMGNLCAHADSIGLVLSGLSYQVYPIRLILSADHYRTQGTLNAVLSHIWDAKGPHSRYWLKKHSIRIYFEVIAALGSETMLKK
ncbi:hypothetical protein BSK64_12355 [Paenibacillus odorifer]|nr:hypothetical protein BSK50_07220 [Paenibacillus odorifer]OME06045.1 hypothetical protein BSK64_12355 [Paenibacillus odorifer]